MIDFILNLINRSGKNRSGEFWGSRIDPTGRKKLRSRIAPLGSFIELIQKRKKLRTDAQQMQDARLHLIAKHGIRKGVRLPHALFFMFSHY